MASIRDYFSALHIRSLLDQVHYLLSENRRSLKRNEGNDWATYAVNGAITLPDFMSGSQGLSSGFSPPLIVRYIASELQKVTLEDMKPFFNRKKMYEQGVYKMSPEGTDWEAYYANYLHEFFEPWRDFYLAAAQHNEGVLVLTD